MLSVCGPCVCQRALRRDEVIFTSRDGQGILKLTTEAESLVTAALHKYTICLQVEQHRKIKGNDTFDIIFENILKEYKSGHLSTVFMLV